MIYQDFTDGDPVDGPEVTRYGVTLTEEMVRGAGPDSWVSRAIRERQARWRDDLHPTRDVANVDRLSLDEIRERWRSTGTRHSSITWDDIDNGPMDLLSDEAARAWFDEQVGTRALFTEQMLRDAHPIPFDDTLTDQERLDFANLPPLALPPRPSSRSYRYSTDDAQFDARPDFCWRCDAVAASTPVGLCGACSTDLVAS